MQVKTEAGDRSHAPHLEGDTCIIVTLEPRQPVFGVRRRGLSLEDDDVDETDETDDDESTA